MIELGPKPAFDAFLDDEEGFTVIQDELVDVDDHGDSRREIIVRSRGGEFWGCTVDARRYDGYDRSSADIYRVQPREKIVTEYVRLGS